MLFSLFDRFLCCKQKSSYMLQRCVNARQKRKYVVSKNTPRLPLKLKLGGLVKKEYKSLAVFCLLLQALYEKTNVPCSAKPHMVSCERLFAAHSYPPQLQ